MAFSWMDEQQQIEYFRNTFGKSGVYIIKAMVLSTLDINDKYTTKQYKWNNSGTNNPTWGTCTDDTRLYDGDKTNCDQYALWIKNEDYTNYTQAVHWNLVTIRFNLTADGAFPLPDFDSVGGEEYTYIPYPDTNTVNTTCPKSIRIITP